MQLGTSATGPVPPDEVWERYARPALWPTWAPQIRSVDAPHRLATGSEGRVHGVLGLEADFVVHSWDDAAREWSWTATTRLPFGTRGPTLYLAHGVLATGTGSRAWVELRGAPWVAPYVAPAKLALYRLVH